MDILNLKNMSNPIIKIYCDERKRIWFKNINKCNKLIENPNTHILYTDKEGKQNILSKYDYVGPDLNGIHCNNIDEANKLDLFKLSNIDCINPININKYDIYDIYHNDNNKLIIISPSENKPLTIKYNNINFNIHICSHGHTTVYVSKGAVKYNKKIKLNINNDFLEVNVNKYPEFKGEIIMSTIVKDEDNYIRQWIEFHRNLGITRFIIYDNSNKGTLSNILSDYINNKIVILINWSYSYRLRKSGISGQTTQQTHSIWAFNNCKYIGLFDIDEYVNIQSDTNIHTFFNNLIKKENINTNNIGCFTLLNKLFYNPDNLPSDGYKFLKIYNCDIAQGGEKCFVIPKNVNTHSVHTITNGKSPLSISPKKIYFNHYLYLNKTDRGRNKTNIIDDTINKHLDFL